MISFIRLVFSSLVMHMTDLIYCCYCCDWCWWFFTCVSVVAVVITHYTLQRHYYVWTIDIAAVSPSPYHYTAASAPLLCSS